MAPLKEATRLAVRRLYFVERQSIAAIAEALGISIDSVRDALVFRSKAAAGVPATSRRKESDS